MADLKRRRRASTSKPTVSKRRSERPEVAALAVFALLTAVTPLAFGAVDRVIQIALLLLFALGLFFRPPEIIPLSRRGTALLLALAAVLVVKEFAPAPLFGGAQWRSIVVSDFGLTLPWTHHPEPGRAVDALLAILVAGLWFLWVRTLAGTRANRPWLAWALFASAALVAAVSFATHGLDAQAIYGLRYTPGWTGFGPFPNRNHTACFLAMGTLMGGGCLTWAAMRRKQVLLVLGLAMAGCSVAGLLATQSRGGLIALGVGALIYVVLVLSKLRTRRSLAMAGGACLVVALMAITFGGPLLARFNAPASAVSNDTRRQIWHETVGMWKDAPLFGHGAESFGSLFPLYQHAQMDNQEVLHPESSWLLWLVEFGLLPVAAGVVVLGWFLWRHARLAFRHHYSFFPMAAGLAATGALLAHSAVDVPAHRWGTAGFALAALALAAPLTRREDATAAEWNLSFRSTDHRVALVPLVIAIFWVLPFLVDGPAWSPTEETRLVNQAIFSTVPASKMQHGLDWFPLDPTLHELLGLQQMHDPAQTADDEWKTHLRLASRLSPGSWALPMIQARACRDADPALALSLWQLAVDRSGFRAAELLGNGLQETASLPGSRAVWNHYARARPELALAYAGALPAAEGKQWYRFWWEQRSPQPLASLQPYEIEGFYGLAARFGTLPELEQWMHRASARTRTDYPHWASILHEWHEDRRAWEMLSQRRPEPAWPPKTIALTREQLEHRWERQPDNIVNAQMLAAFYHDAGDEAKAKAVLLQSAQRPGAPQWFIRKGAYLQAAAGDLPAAVTTMLRETPPK